MFQPEIMTNGTERQIFVVTLLTKGLGSERIMNKRNMQFLYGDRELLIRAGDIMTANTTVIVNPAQPNLSHQQGLSKRILERAGALMQEQSAQLIREHGELESGMAVYTSAGDLPYEAIIHAVTPEHGEDNLQQHIQLSVSRSLKLCEINEWASIALPIMNNSVEDLPLDVCASGYFRAITSFWDARLDGFPEQIQIFAAEHEFADFFHAFRAEATSAPALQETPPASVGSASDAPIGHVSLDEAELEVAEDDEINAWFK